MLAKQLKYLMLQRVYFILMLAKLSFKMHFTHTVCKCQALLSRYKAPLFHVTWQILMSRETN